jgi:hypothetical protein
MLFRDSLSSLLPAPRDDEPASLRQDIIDELGDHLANVYRRELLSGADSNLARQRVLDRFGDPAALARRLWLDAMKGKIMAQRVLIATCLVVMLACGASVGLAWNWMNQDRLLRNRESAAAIEANRRMADALAQAQATNKDMLNKLSEMSEAIRHPVSPDWNPLTFKLTEESAAGPPAVGVSATLWRMVGAAVTNVDRTSDESGIADFGAVQPGDYTFRLTRSWPKGEYTTEGKFTVRPATEVHKTIACPNAPTGTVSVRIKYAWPADLEAAGLFLYTPFTFLGRSFDRGVLWRWDELSGPNIQTSEVQRYPVTRSLLCGTKGTQSFEFVDLAALHLWKAAKSKQTFGDILDRDLRQRPAGDVELQWERGSYQLAELMVIRPYPGRDVEKGRRRFDVLVSVCSSDYGHWCQEDVGPPGAGIIEMPYPQIAGHGTAAPFGSQGVVPEDYWDKTVAHFEARPGQVNEWTVPLPDELIKAVRAALAADPGAKTNPPRPAAAALLK